MDAGSRNIFYEDDGMVGAHPSLPAADVIRGSKVLLIDHLGMAGNLRAAREARAAGRAVVADFEDQSHPLFPEVLHHVDHLILCEDFALELAQRSTAAEAALALWQPSRAVVIVTTGFTGCWSVDASTTNDARHHPAFRVEAKDTTGCGDVFHGAYAAQLARGESLEKRIRYASAAAALKAMSGEIPGSAAVQDFLASNSVAMETTQN
jgi:sugar/nucleoside kinase (ribokinase family)